jgi:bacteriocin-like protein
MKTLTIDELREISGGFNPVAYEAGHAAGDFAQMIVRGVLLLGTFFLKA